VSDDCVVEVVEVSRKDRARRRKESSMSEVLRSILVACYTCRRPIAFTKRVTAAMAVRKLYKIA
jgi:hypothetical protein